MSPDDMEELLKRVTSHVKAIAPHDDIHALVTDFKSFVRRGNIVDLAIGMIMGTSFTAILQSLVVDILSPVLSLVSTRSMANYFAVIRCPTIHKDCTDSTWETPMNARDAGAITINYGLFIENVVRFFINAIFLYFAVKQAMVVVSRLNKLMKSVNPLENATQSLDANAQTNKIVPTASN